ncbi:uncharacterized protein Z520_04572 [Fonsecaea multimorphosa CBS 102226]|uniref:Uncharacterized protein n=1 Tax=Fonsecaea multimorphosa CBS 102226 TaxID=1442371 RepID=A0A0D2K9X6_9EURO|nr:uncharacterized protein Z520_04572 [Fonsecaea multimorphosa CBS 102226]KIX99934.1 hypothetical protein Z520_04572 [Fonsecaea multimorphosa CBS 102226]OAL26409.1 hypothetical protein AYO22_04327 [Fonsecaea multimorphosa]
MAGAVPRPDANMTRHEPVPYEELSRSTIYTMIPSVVRSRIPVLTSLRHTAKTVVLHGTSVRRRAGNFSCIESTKEKDSYEFASTANSSGTTTPTIRPESPEGSIPSQDLTLRMLPPLEVRSGVDWDVALTGVRLWVNAKTQAEQGGDPVALRSMHIDALRYMHMALPSDLTPLEIQTLRASMSTQLISQAENLIEYRARRQPNILRQGVAQAVCWLVAGLLLVLPIIMTLLNRLLQFERDHQVTERVLANGIDLTSALGDRGAELHQAIVRFKDGRVGGACVELGSWFVEGIVGGVNDGIDAVAQTRRKASVAKCPG